MRALDWRTQTLSNITEVPVSRAYLAARPDLLHALAAEAAVRASTRHGVAERPSALTGSAVGNMGDVGGGQVCTASESPCVVFLAATLLCNLMAENDCSALVSPPPPPPATSGPPPTPQTDLLTLTSDLGTERVIPLAKVPALVHSALRRVERHLNQWSPRTSYVQTCTEPGKAQLLSC